MDPQLRYARTSDGVSIAYAAVGRGPPLVWLPPVPLSNVVAQFRVPVLRDVYERMAARVRLVLYDGRGSGHSQRDVQNLDLDAMLLDLQAVAVDARLGSLALFGYYHSVPMALAFAARHPTRVTRLILFGGTARGMDAMSSPETQALLSLIGRDWDLFAESAAHAWMGWSAGESGRLAAEAFRTSTSPTVAATTMEAFARVDVTAELGAVSAPVRILYRESGLPMLREASQRLAAALSHGEVHALRGAKAALFVDDVDGDVAAIVDFMLPEDAPTASMPREFPDDVGGRLTPRELEILRQLAKGDSNGEIAAALGISVNTVERHAVNLYRKIGVRGRSEAAAYAVRRGIA